MLVKENNDEDFVGKQKKYKVYSFPGWNSLLYKVHQKTKDVEP